MAKHPVGQSPATLSLAQDTSDVNGRRSAGMSGRPHPAHDGTVPSQEDAA